MPEPLADEEPPKEKAEPLVASSKADTASDVMKH